MILVKNKLQGITSVSASDWQDVFGRRSHALWETLHFIKENPGRRLIDVKAHLEAAYPHGSRNVFNWAVSGGQRGNRQMMAQLGLYEVVKGRFHILSVGAAIADQEKPQYKAAKPQTTPAAWLLDHSPERGKMLIARDRFLAYVVSDTEETGGPVTCDSYTNVEKDEICIFLCEWTREVLKHGTFPLRNAPRWTGPAARRQFGRDKADCLIAVIAGNRTVVCVAGNLRSADRLARKNKRKEVTNANQ